MNWINKFQIPTKGEYSYSVLPIAEMPLPKPCTQCCLIGCWSRSMTGWVPLRWTVQWELWTSMVLRSVSCPKSDWSKQQSSHTFFVLWNMTWQFLCVPPGCRIWGWTALSSSVSTMPMSSCSTLSPGQWFLRSRSAGCVNWKDIQDEYFMKYWPNVLIWFLSIN